MSGRGEDKVGGLSPTTLAIASAASAAAAIFIHEFWSGGAILGAAITPIIVAVVSELLKKPAERITTVRVQRRGSTGGTAGDPAPARAPSGRPDPHGIWEADRQSGLFRLRGRHLKLALATGALAFVVGAVALTGVELVFGGSVGGGERTTIFSSDRDRGRDEDDDRDAPAATQPADTGEQTEPVPAAPPPAATAPGQTTPPPGEEPVPAPETATTPGQTAPPGASTTPGPVPPGGG